ncbi:MAG: hypothetical protein AAFN91_13400 [Pseudomonadota bacterium]
MAHFHNGFDVSWNVQFRSDRGDGEVFMMLADALLSLSQQLRQVSNEKRVGFAVPLLMLAGAAGYHHVDGGGRIYALLVYIASLSVSVLIISGAKWITGGSRIEPSALSSVLLRKEVVPTTISEDVGLEERANRVLRSTTSVTVIANGMQQADLDFDGIEELRALEEITGAWLVSKASERVADAIRHACVEHLAGNEVEIARIYRWLDISDCLKSSKCRALSKAELRRSFAAEQCGVSKEQVRQIDQGRYAPLNKILNQLNPQTLAEQI